MNINLPAPIKPAAPVRIIRTSRGVNKNTKTYKDLLEEDVTEAYLDALTEKNHLGENSHFVNKLQKDLEIPKQKIVLINDQSERIL